MIVLTVDEIMLLHDKLIAATGGSPGLRDMALLESAVFSVSSGFGEEESYPTVEEKAARFAFALTQNHAFVDGNKRIGILAMLTTLRLNGMQIEYTQHELVDLGLSIAKSTAKYDDVLAWLRQRIK
ncbi:type II toxin-antitoxin system death-on-curing family toxin [Ruminococcaceae bacterium OttesenSCG-928-A11]|nr:type II toxin-antitoxin system death-on-curing family toxin [Ruminococcaceae bacterium OttesenSCG-928-A11]